MASQHERKKSVKLKQELFDTVSNSSCLSLRLSFHSDLPFRVKYFKPFKVKVFEVPSI